MNLAPANKWISYSRFRLINLKKLANRNIAFFLNFYINVTFYSYFVKKKILLYIERKEKCTL